MKSAVIVFFIAIFLSLTINTVAQNSLMDEVSDRMIDTLIKLSRANYPRLKALSKKVDIAHSDLNKMRLSWFDGLGLYYLYLPPNSAGTVANPTTNRNGFQLGFSLNVGSLLEKPAQIKAAKYEKMVASLEKDEFDLSIVASVKERYYKYVQQVTLLKQKIQMTLDAQTLLSSVKVKFEKGTESFENYNKSLAVFNQQKEQQINTEADLLIAKSSLEELVGVTLGSIVLEPPIN